MIQEFKEYCEKINNEEKKIINILKQKGYTLEEAELIYREIFEKCLDKEIILNENTIIFIVELLETMKNKSIISISNKDIRHLSFGSYSIVSQIGEYVLKLGKHESSYKILNDKRILQPLLQKELKSDEDSLIIEVQDLVDTEWYNGLNQEEINEKLYYIYSDLRNRGIIWNDIKKENVGRLLKPKKVYSLREENKYVEETLPIGELVVIDSDYLSCDISKIDEKYHNNLEWEFRKRYESEKDRKEMTK